MVIKLLTVMENKWSPFIVHVFVCLTCGRMMYSQSVPGCVSMYCVCVSERNKPRKYLDQGCHEKWWMDGEVEKETNTERQKLSLSVPMEIVSEQAEQNERRKGANLCIHVPTV